jgi:hypothetical protein
VNAIINFFAGWQIKLVLVLALVFGAYTWHKAEVRVAVKETVAQIEMQSNKERFKLLDKANDATNQLKDQLAKNQKEKDRELQIANRKYNDLLEWVRNLPSQTGSGDSSGSASDSEAGREEVIAELRRRHASDLAKYSHDAEEVRLALLQCYRDFDAVKAARDKFVKENSPKTD